MSAWLDERVGDLVSRGYDPLTRYDRVKKRYVAWVRGSKDVTGDSHSEALANLHEWVSKKLPPTTAELRRQES